MTPPPPVKKVSFLRHFYFFFYFDAFPNQEFIFLNQEIVENFTEQSQNYNTHRISKLLLKYLQIPKYLIYVFFTLEKRLSLITYELLVQKDTFTRRER